MMLGQSAAAAACMAIDGKIPVQKINVKKLQLLLKTNPLADNSTPEILVDNDDASAITVSGNWKKEENFKGCYGPSTYINNGLASAKDFVRFTPHIKKTGNYNIYAYVAKFPGSSSHINLLIGNGMQEENVAINTGELVVKGQTEGEWVSLGRYHFSVEKKGYATITCKKANGIVSADALLFIPERN